MQENYNFSNNIEPILVQIYIFFSSQDGDSDVHLLFLFVCTVFSFLLLCISFYYCFVSYLNFIVYFFIIILLYFVFFPLISMYMCTTFVLCSPLEASIRKLLSFCV